MRPRYTNCVVLAHTLGQCKNGRALDYQAGDCFDPFYCSVTVGDGPTLACAGLRFPTRSVGFVIQDDGGTGFDAVNLNFSVPFVHVQIPQNTDGDTVTELLHDSINASICMPYNIPIMTSPPTAMIPIATASPTAGFSLRPSMAPTEVPTINAQCIEFCRVCVLPTPSISCEMCDSYYFLFNGSCISDLECTALAGYSAEIDRFGNPVTREELGNQCQCIDDDERFIQTALDIGGYRFRDCAAAAVEGHCTQRADQYALLSLAMRR